MTFTDCSVFSGKNVEFLIEIPFFTIFFKNFSVPSEVKLLRREYFNRWYGLTSYYFAMSMSRIPPHLIYTSAYVVIVYVLTDQPLELDRCAMFLSISLIIGIISESLGLLLSSFLSVVVS